MEQGHEGLLDLTGRGVASLVHQVDRAGGIGENFDGEAAGLGVGGRSENTVVAFDAGYCAALGKPYVTLHDADIVHPLREVDARAQSWCTATDQVVETLRYVLQA